MTGSETRPQVVTVLGANGVYGRHLTPRLVRAGFKVRAIVRRPEAADVARGCGAEVRVADIFQQDTLAEALGGCDVCVNLATSLPGPSGRGDYETNDRVRREGVPILLEACAAAGVSRLVQQSIAMVCAGGEILVGEEGVHEPAGDGPAARAIRASLAMESAVTNSGFDWVILRGGLFYGPGTGFDSGWFERAEAGKLRVPGDGKAFVTLVHISDMAAATVAALRAWPSRQALNVVDDEPVRWGDLFGYIAQVSGSPAPQLDGPMGFESFRLSNSRARETLKWAPHYPDFRIGLAR